MTIFWEFYNTQQGKEFCRASLQSAVSDSDFSFNLAVHRKGDKTWIRASRNFISGAQIHRLNIEAQPDQNVILLIEDINGNQKKLSFNINDYWVSGGDIGSIRTVVDYQGLFKNK